MGQMPKSNGKWYAGQDWKVILELERLMTEILLVLL